MVIILSPNHGLVVKSGPEADVARRVINHVIYYSSYLC
jgi:hypothetical protein